MAQSPPILIYTPGGGVAVGPISNPPVYSQKGTTQLIEGQAYIDVVFGSIQTNDEWVLVTCEVENTTDADPLNIWPGIITDRTAAGFRLQLNGMPDSGNYYLHWAVSGVNITPTPASTYYLTGPSSGTAGVDATFTVRLPPSTTVSGTVTVTPDDGGAAGVFSPTSVALTMSSASATFVYTPASYGAITISVTNSSTLTDPASIVFTVATPTYTLTGPSGGVSGVASTNFTVTLPVGVVGTVIVTMHDASAGGTFTPTTLSLVASGSGTFTYTPASAGAKTISVTNNGGLTNPANLTYTATAPVFDPGSIAGLLLWLKADAIVGLASLDPVSTWTDSSSAGNNATQSGTLRPLYITNQINSLPAVAFGESPTLYFTLTHPIPASTEQPWTVIAVMRNEPGGSHYQVSTGSSTTAGGYFGPVVFPAGNLNLGSQSFSIAASPAVSITNAWHVLTGTQGRVLRVDGAVQGIAGVAVCNPSNMDTVGGHPSVPTWSSGRIAELLVYNSNLSSGDMTLVEDYLKTKYGL